ncbi:MAG: HD domain-containing protein [Lachnospiraceae bacterium]|nr:HD domain-containing protein [Lachnospiraceae bacterium]
MRKDRVLVVDDDETICELVRSLMEPVYEIGVTLSGKDAVRRATEFIPDLILLDIHLSDADGFAIMDELKKSEKVADIPVLLLTGDNDTVTEENGFKRGASDYVRKPFAPDVLRVRAKRIIDLHHYQKSIEDEVKRQTELSRRLTREMMLALSKTVDTKDHYTDGHSRRVAAICAEIGRRLGKTQLDQIKLYEVGLLHDIGKIGIHDDIIRKNTRLTDDEFAIVKAHTVKGYQILKEITDMPKLCEGAHHHHEKYNGSGYPDGLAGEAIPEEARIACIADCYDAMTSTRTYSTPRKQEDVRAEILRCRGTWFDPKITDVMLGMIDEDSEYRMNENADGGDVWKEYDRLWGDMSVPYDANGAGFGAEIRMAQGSGDMGVDNEPGKTVSPDNSDDPGNSVYSAISNGSRNTVYSAIGNAPEKTVGSATGNAPEKTVLSVTSDEEDLPEWIGNIAELDSLSGRKNCGGTASYISVLTVFYRTAKRKADDIERYYRARDIAGYTVKVHALKSSARIIGASELSMLAEQLENAGKNGNTVFICENTERLLKMYGELGEKLSHFDNKISYYGNKLSHFDNKVSDCDDRPGALPKIETKELKEAYQTIAEIAESMDYGMMEDMLKSLNEYELPEKDRRIIDEVGKMLIELDWDGILGLVKTADT